MTMKHSANAYAASREEANKAPILVVLRRDDWTFIGEARLTLDEARGFAVRLQEAIDAAEPNDERKYKPGDFVSMG